MTARLARLGPLWLAAILLPAFGAKAAPDSWVGTWATSQQVPEPENALPAEALHDATLRQFIRVSLGGKVLRVRISNAFGTAPFTVDAVHIARPVPGTPGAIDPSTDRALTFSGRESVTIPAAADYLSDPIAYDLPPLSGLAISIRYEDPPAQQTAHPGSRTTSYYAHGDFVAAAELPNPSKIDHWYQIAGIDVIAPGARAVVVLGDSITDGRGSTTNGNDRWTDALAERLAPLRIGVLNAGLGGNRLLNDSKGPNAVSRIDRDILGQPGVKYVIVLEGINDIGTLTQSKLASPAEHGALVGRMLSAYEQVVERAHARGIKVYGATILPFMGTKTYHPDASNEADRQAVNWWIRGRGNFDAVLDFDVAMRDPAQRDRLNPKFDVGDFLHPSPPGYRAMAAAVPLAMFVRGERGKRVAAKSGAVTQ